VRNMSVQLAKEPKKKTETVSFRLNATVRSTLEEEAKKLGINMNTLVSQIFSQYLDWERYADRLKFLPVSKHLLRETFQPMNRENVEKMARRLGETSARDEILFLFQQINLGTVVRFLELWSDHFDACEHRYDGRKHFFTLHHDVNLNFSYFAKEYVSSMMHSTIAKSVQFESVSANSVTFSFEA
jgi:5,10-methylenetetrahydrofolate reductase